MDKLKVLSHKVLTRTITQQDCFLPMPLRDNRLPISETGDATQAVSWVQSLSVLYLSIFTSPPGH